MRLDWYTQSVWYIPIGCCKNASCQATFTGVTLESLSNHLATCEQQANALWGPLCGSLCATMQPENCDCGPTIFVSRLAVVRILVLLSSHSAKLNGIWMESNLILLIGNVGTNWFRMNSKRFLSSNWPCVLCWSLASCETLWLCDVWNSIAFRLCISLVQTNRPSEPQTLRSQVNGKWRTGPVMAGRRRRPSNRLCTVHRCRVQTLPNASQSSNTNSIYQIGNFLKSNCSSTDCCLSCKLEADAIRQNYFVKVTLLELLC